MPHSHDKHKTEAFYIFFDTLDPGTMYSILISLFYGIFTNTSLNNNYTTCNICIQVSCQGYPLVLL